MNLRVAAAVALIMCCVVPQAFAANLLTNPGFESFPAGASYSEGAYNLYNWRFFSVGGAGGSLLVVSPGQEGNIALKLTRAVAAGDTALDRDSNKIPAIPGHRYRATVWAKSDTGAILLLTLAAHDASGNWLGVQRQTSFPVPVPSSYKQYTIEFTAPAGTALLNFGIRLNWPGSITVDNCQLTDLNVLPSPPAITYPCGEAVDSFSPAIAFAGPSHTAYQAIVSNDSGTLWDSGTVNSTAYKLTCPVALAQNGSYKVKVRLQNSTGWSDYSADSTFTTPAAPIVNISSPAEADTASGYYLPVTWKSESPTGVTGQSVSIDGKSPVNLGGASSLWYFWDLTEGLHSVTVTATSAEGAASDTARFYYHAAPSAGSGTLYYYDLSYLWNTNHSDPVQIRQVLDISLAVIALQGLVNRGGPRLFVRFWNEDDKWWDRMVGYGSWLGNKNIVYLPSGIDNLPTLFNTFKADYKGAVTWDPNVNATANVACTVAGADDLIPVRYDPSLGSIYDRLVVNGPRIPVSTSLVNRFTGTGTIWGTSIPSTRSKKNDAYIWARTNYLETGKSNPSILNYAIDGYWLSNSQVAGFPGYAVLSRDYVIQNKGFVVDLSVWGDERPIDDPNQTLGLDLSTFRSILAAAAARAPGMIHMVDAKPWPFKYTNYLNGAGGKHEPVLYEWECARWFTDYNAYSDADSYAPVDLANASIYSKYPLPDRLTQNRRLSRTDLRKLGYIDSANRVSPINFLNLYIGDYDSAKWLLGMASDLWDDYNRGAVPMSWAFNPNLIDRVAAIYEYYNRTRTANDSFIAGDSGSGYVNPSRLIGVRESGLPSARDIWVSHNLNYFRKTNIKISGFLLNGTAGPLGSDADDMFRPFSVDGVFSQPSWYPQGDHMAGSMPAMIQMGDLANNNAATDANSILIRGLQGLTQFLNYRTVLVSPTYVRDVYNGVTSADTTVPWALVDAPTYAALMKDYMGVLPDCRATYTFDTLPGTIRAGKVINAAIGIRNDGWAGWSASGSQGVSLLVNWKQGSKLIKTSTVPLPRDVPSGRGIALDVALTAPSAPGSYILSYEMARQGAGFSSMGDYAWEKPMTVDVPLEGGSVTAVKSYPDGTVVALRDVVVTAGTDDFADRFYVEDASRVAGIRISTSGCPTLSVAVGDRVELVGTLSTDSGERVLLAPTLLSKTPAH